MLQHIYFYTTISTAYTVEIPDGMTAWEVAGKLGNSLTFYVDKLGPDLNEAEWDDIDVDVDDWTDEVDITAGQVIDWIARG